jgi:hypothetical protein
VRGHGSSKLCLLAAVVVVLDIDTIINFVGSELLFREYVSLDQFNGCEMKNYLQ